MLISAPSAELIAHSAPNSALAWLGASHEKRLSCFASRPPNPLTAESDLTAQYVPPSHSRRDRRFSSKAPGLATSIVRPLRRLHHDLGIPSHVRACRPLVRRD